MKVYLAMLGCKLNESEIEAWSRQLSEQGDEIVGTAGEAEICIVNTCTVTQAAAKKSRLLAKKIAHSNPDAKIVMTGCFATMSPRAASALPNVTFVVPNADKDQLVALTARYRSDSTLQLSTNGCRMPEAASGELDANQDQASLPHLRTRAFVKIEDGCNMSCSYCIIPLARGKARSRPHDEIVAEVKRLVESGYQEVILTGVQISDYDYRAREAGEGRLGPLSHLVRSILAETGVPRLRLTSIAPWDLEPEFLDLFDEPRLCRHLHLSLQSGSSTVLKRMRRPYDTARYAEAVRQVRIRVPDAAITTDVIVGFPGESDAEFEASVDFVREMQFSRVHVFPYSAREGTAAAQLPQVPEHVREARTNIMQRVADEMPAIFASRFIGRTLPVLYESSSNGSGVWSGYTDNYIRVVTPAEGNLSNRIIQSRLIERVEDGVRGALG